MCRQVHVRVCMTILYVSVYVSVKLRSCFLSPYTGLTPLHLAVLRGHKDLARMLLDAGADINAMVRPCATLSQR